MICLSHFSTAYTTHVTHLPTWGISANLLPDIYDKVDTGLVYPMVNLAKLVHFDEETCAKLKEKPVDKQAFLLAAGNTHFAGLQTADFSHKELSYVYKMLPMTLTQIFAAKFAQRYGNFQHISVDSSACTSSLHVLSHVHHLITHFGFERVFVLAVDDALAPNVLQFFINSGVITKGRPSAFDSHNFGFNLGNGAVLAVFEKYAYLSGEPYAQLMGAYSASEDGLEAMGQRTDGQGYTRAIEGLKDYFGDLDYSIIKTHGSGTISNNTAEKNGLKCLNENWIATGYKSHIGHTLGSSGLLETCLLYEELKTNGLVPPITNRSVEDDVFLSRAAKPRNLNVLSLACGMGNIFTAAGFLGLF